MLYYDKTKDLPDGRSLFWWNKPISRRTLWGIFSRSYLDSVFIASTYSVTDFMNISLLSARLVGMNCVIDIW